MSRYIKVNTQVSHSFITRIYVGTCHSTRIRFSGFACVLFIVSLFVHILVMFNHTHHSAPSKGCLILPLPRQEGHAGLCWRRPAPQEQGFVGSKLTGDWGPGSGPSFAPDSPVTPTLVSGTLAFLGPADVPATLLVAGRTVHSTALVPVGAAPISGCWASPLTQGSESRFGGLGNSSEDRKLACPEVGRQREVGGYPCLVV